MVNLFSLYGQSLFSLMITATSSDRKRHCRPWRHAVAQGPMLARLLLYILHCSAARDGPLNGGGRDGRGGRFQQKGDRHRSLSADSRRRWRGACRGKWQTSMAGGDEAGNGPACRSPMTCSSFPDHLFCCNPQPANSTWGADVPHPRSA